MWARVAADATDGYPLVFSDRRRRLHESIGPGSRQWAFGLNECAGAATVDTRPGQPGKLSLRDTSSYSPGSRSLGPRGFLGHRRAANSDIVRCAGTSSLLPSVRANFLRSRSGSGYIVPDRLSPCMKWRYLNRGKVKQRWDDVQRFDDAIKAVRPHLAPGASMISGTRLTASSAG